MNKIAGQRARCSRFFAIASLGLLIACGGGGKPPKAAEGQTGSDKTEAPPPAAPADTKAPESGGVAESEPVAPSGPPVVRLIEPGAQPRQKLRYKFAVGQAQWMQLDMKMKMDTAGQAISMPTIRTVMRLDPKSVSAEGDLTYEFESVKVEVLKDPKADKALVSTLQNLMSKLVGMKGSATVTPRGISKEVKLTAPPDWPEEVTDTLENMRQSIDQLCVPLPEEEVGKGAKWEVVQHVVTPSMYLTQKSEHVLRELRGNSGSIDVTLSQEAPPQEIKSKKLAGAKVHMTSMHSTGKAKMSLTLDKLVPKSNMDMSLEMAMQVETQDQKVPMTMKMDMEMIIGPSTAPKK